MLMRHASCNTRATAGALLQYLLSYSGMCTSTEGYEQATLQTLIRLG